MMLLMVLTLLSCREEQTVPNYMLELSDYGVLRDSSLRMDVLTIRRHIHSLVRQSHDSVRLDNEVAAYYASNQPFLWMSRLGPDYRADTLLSLLEGAEREGFKLGTFRVGQLREDLSRFRLLRFDEAGNDINRVAARLEYYLTKAFVNYTAVQGYGFLDPRVVLNRFDVKERDSLRVTYHRLFDIPVKQPGEAFFQRALHMISADSLSAFVAETRPKGEQYDLLLQRLASSDLSEAQHRKLQCNLERCRWRLTDYPASQKKYVLVNIPAYSLYAVSPDSVLSMRIGCGTQRTKTPLLTSRIYRMDLNPQWIIPQSIVTKDIVHHLGDPSWFEKRRYFVSNRKTGKRMDLGSVSYSMLANRECLVIQEGGRGNSLGRIIFRFDNNFSVFLHDTSTPAFFSRDSRDVSHGCIRVEKPYQLAAFLLEDPSDEVLEKISYSMAADLSDKASLDSKRLVRSLNVDPKVPLYVTYYTFFATPGGQLREYPDVYGYDRVIYQHLKKYIE